MNRRGFFAMLAGLPFLRKRPTIRLIDPIAHIPMRVGESRIQIADYSDPTRLTEALEAFAGAVHHSLYALYAESRLSEAERRFDPKRLPA